MKKLEKNKYYILKMNLQGRILEYTGKIIDLNEKEFFLKTEEDCRLNFKLKDLIKFQEIEEPKKEEKVFKIFSKKKFIDLKKNEEPEF